MFVFTCVSTTSAPRGVANAYVRVLTDLFALPLLLRKTAISCCRHEMMLSRNFTCAQQDAPRPSSASAWCALATVTHPGSLFARKESQLGARRILRHAWFSRSDTSAGISSGLCVEAMRNATFFSASCVRSCCCSSFICGCARRPGCSVSSQLLHQASLRGGQGRGARSTWSDSTASSSSRLYLLSVHGRERP